MADSYYTVIKGKKFDRRMLELAEGLTKGRGDGRISVSDAKNLLRVVKDASNYSITEKQTMEYIRKRYKFTKEGDEFFRNEIRKWAASKGKKKPAAKSSKGSKSASKAQSSAAAVSEPVQHTPAHSISTASTEAPARGSAWKEILLGLFLLLAAAALFYYLAYKSGCSKSAPPQAEAVPQVITPKPAEVPAPKPPAATDLKSFVEKTQLTFIAEKSELTPVALKSIDALADRLKGEKAKIQITGHTCSLGPQSLNQLISEKRARVVKEALVARGVSADTIQTRGVAASEPVGDNKTVAGRVANRRVTFKLLN